MHFSFYPQQKKNRKNINAKLCNISVTTNYSFMLDPLSQQVAPLLSTLLMSIQRYLCTNLCARLSVNTTVGLTWQTVSPTQLLTHPPH